MNNSQNNPPDSGNKPVDNAGRPPERRPRVYVLHDDSSKNLYPASIHGDMVVYTRREMSLFDQGWVTELEGWLADYKPYRDHILLVGDPTLIGVACAIIGRNWDNISLLKWDRQEKKYIPVRFYFE